MDKLTSRDIKRELAPLLSTLNFIRTSLEVAGEGDIDYQKGQDELIRLLDAAKSSSDKLVQSRYLRLCEGEQCKPKALIESLGHSLVPENPAGEGFLKSLFGKKKAAKNEDSSTNYYRGHAVIKPDDPSLKPDTPAQDQEPKMVYRGQTVTR